MRKILSILAGAVICTGFAAVPSVMAATPDDAAAVARSMGLPEEMIQAGYNQYYASPELFPPEVIDSYIASLRGMSDDMIRQLIQDNGYSPQQTPPVPVVTSYVETPSEPTVTTAADTPAPAEKLPPNKQPIQYTLPDGTTFTRVSVDEFAAMSLEEKKAYIASFPSEQQNIIIQNLSPEEYKSLLKQMPVDEKANIIDSMTEITNNMGLTLTVDELTDDNLTMSMHDPDGKLVAVGAVKDTVANTGYDRRGILAIAAALILIGAGGAAIVTKKCFGESQEG